MANAEVRCGLTLSEIVEEKSAPSVTSLMTIFCTYIDVTREWQ